MLNDSIGIIVGGGGRVPAIAGEVLEARREVAERRIVDWAAGNGKDFASEGCRGRSGRGESILSKRLVPA